MLNVNKQWEEGGREREGGEERIDRKNPVGNLLYCLTIVDYNARTHARTHAHTHTYTHTGERARARTHALLLPRHTHTGNG